MAWLTGGDVKARVRAVLGVQAFEANTGWDQITDDAAEMAKADLLTLLGRRGFTEAQLSAWDGLAAYNAGLALWWALNLAGATKDFSDTFIKSLDRREELATVAVSYAGVRQAPAVPPVAGGQQSTDNDVFKPDDRDMDVWNQYREKPWG